jgi:hypothetical protein
MPPGCSIKGKLAVRAHVTGHRGIYHMERCRSYARTNQPASHLAQLSMLGRLDAATGGSNENLTNGLRCGVGDSFIRYGRSNVGSSSRPQGSRTLYP